MAEYVCSIKSEPRGVRYKFGERIVRCRNCKFYEDGECVLLELIVANMDNGFCAWGEERGA